MRYKEIKLFIGLLLVVLSCISLGVGQRAISPAIIPPIPQEQFSPSNTKTVNDQLIPVSSFFPAERCAECHSDVYAAWSQSLHRNAAREPFYRESADILLRTRGIEFTRHCESCHTPVALVAGTLTQASGKTQAPFTSMDHEGISCTICHSIVEARPDGTGSYTIRPPALLVKEDGTPVFGDMPDEEILANVEDHKRAMMRPLLKKPEFCATCHKVTAPPTLNGYKQLPGFSAYDEWQASGASKESLTPFYPRAERTDCRGCHMPKVDATTDYAAKDGKIVLHRWPGANTAAPLFYNQHEQVDVTKKFLQDKVLEVDIFAVKSESANNQLQTLANNQTNAIQAQPGESITASVVVANRNAAHSFPPEVRDLYEAWIDFEVIDSNGKSLFHSGYLKPDGTLDPSAHVYKTLLLDRDGHTITRHQIWLTKIKGYDNAIQAGRSDVAHYRFHLPANISAGAVTLKAKVKYRRFNQEYINYVLGRQQRDLNIPVVEMTATETKLSIAPSSAKFNGNSHRSQQLKPDLQLAKRWNDYGIAQLEQAQYGEAALAFRQAASLSPTDSYLLVNAAIAEMRTERFGHEKAQLKKAEELLEKALQIAPNQLRARYFRALVWRGLDRIADAGNELIAVAKEFPRDREVLRQLGQTLYTMGRLADAQKAFEAILAIDPNDAQAYRALVPIYYAAGRKADAENAEHLYLQWRDDPMAAGVAIGFYKAHPEWRDERIGAHIHEQQSPLRPVLTGTHAAPIDRP